MTTTAKGGVFLSNDLSNTYSKHSIKEAVDTEYIFPDSNLSEPKLVSKFYPNPARDFITFELDKNIENNSKLIIYSFTGRKMTEVQISNLRITVNLGEYYRGLYLFQLVSPKGQVLESGKFQVLK